MILSTIAGILGAVKGVSDLFTSASANVTQPKFVIPKSATDALNLAKYMAAQKELPGQSLMEDSLSSNTAQALKAIKQTTGGQGNTLGALASLFAQQGKAKNQLGIAAAQNWNQNQRQLMGAENQMAQWQDKGWQWDEATKWRLNEQKASQFESAGWQNIMGSINNLAAGQETKAMWDRYEKMFTPKTDVGATPTTLSQYIKAPTQNKPIPSISDYGNFKTPFDWSFKTSWNDYFYGSQNSDAMDMSYLPTNAKLFR